MQRFLLILVLLALLGTATLPPVRAQAMPAVPPRDRLDDAIAGAETALWQHRRADGSWAGDVIMASRHTTYYLLASDYVGYRRQPYYDRALAWVRAAQQPDGTWGQMVIPSASSLSNTAAALLALEVAGVPTDDPQLQKGREYVVRHGGLSAADPLVQVMYAAFGKGEWDAVAIRQFSAEFLLSQPEVLDVLEPFPAWWREGVVPIVALRTLGRAERLSSQEEQAVRLAEEWLSSHQLSDGAWFTAFPTFFAIMALHDIDGERYRPQIEQGFGFLESLQYENGYQRPFELSVWDTGIAVQALRAAGVPACDSRFQPTLRWLRSAQSMGGLGLSETPPGGWAYNPQNLIYSDSDDTAFAVAALSHTMGRAAHDDAGRRSAASAGTQWLWAMQGEDGGWATFIRDASDENDDALPMGQEDHSLADVTGHVLTALGAQGSTAEDERVQAAIAYLERSQTAQGSWYGRWGLSDLYGTVALVGMHDVHADMKAPVVDRAVAWLRSEQNDDGGWGEQFSSWNQSRGISYTEPAASTPEQTAWVVMGLLAAGVPADDPALSQGVTYLLTTQRVDGTWPDHNFTVLGIDPYTNTLYPFHWTLWALGWYRQVAFPDMGPTAAPCDVYEDAFAAIEAPQMPFNPAGGPVRFLTALTPASPTHATLVVELDGEEPAREIVVQVGQAGQAPLYEWRIGDLQPGDRRYDQIEVPATPAERWNLTITYQDRVGQAYTVHHQLAYSAAAVAATPFALSPGVWLVGGLLLLGGGIIWLGRAMLPLAVQNLRRHGWRTVLTSIGVIFGTAAIGATLCLSLAFRVKLIEDFATFGATRLLVLPTEFTFRFGPPAETLSVDPPASFDMEDIEAIRALDDVIAVAPFIQKDLSVEVEGQRRAITVLFVEPDQYREVLPARVASGAFLSDEDAREAVLGFSTAREAFGTTLAVGSTLLIEDTPVTVVGTMAEVGGVRGRVESIVSPDIVLYMPLDTAERFTNQTHFDGIEVRAITTAAVASVEQDVRRILDQRHPNETLGVVTGQTFREQVESLLGQFTAIMMVVCLFTLVVSGIGVANMMMVGIRERTAEIGMMKALGATDRTVMGIFLWEAACLGLFSAVIGSVLGFGVLTVLQVIAEVNVIGVTPYLIGLLFLFSLLITVGFGTYPAYLTARLEPAEAIRRG